LNRHDRKPEESISMGNSGVLIACGIFRRELESVLSAEKRMTVHWLDAALHADAGRMKAAFEQTIAEVMARPTDRIRFLFGSGCHPDIGRIAEICGGRIPPVKNCLQAIIGPEKTRDLEANRTMVVTPAWIDAWPAIMNGLGWDAVDVRINLGRYDRILLLDAGLAPISDEAILSFYDLVQVPIEIEPIDLQYFETLVNHLLEDR
jgi:hypothetical protein